MGKFDQFKCNDDVPVTSGIVNVADGEVSKVKIESIEPQVISSASKDPNRNGWGAKVTLVALGELTDVENRKHAPGYKPPIFVQTMEGTKDQEPTKKKQFQDMGRQLMANLCLAAGSLTSKTNRPNEITAAFEAAEGKTVTCKFGISKKGYQTYLFSKA